MTVVFDEQEDGTQLGATSEHFIAIWGNGFDCHMTFCVPPEWQPLADKIEAVLADFLPLRPIWEWPDLQPVQQSE